LNQDDIWTADRFRDPNGRPIYYTRAGTPIDNGADVEAMLADRAGRRVAEDRLVGPDGVWCKVSTVFLVLDHSFSWDPDAPPLLFETMIFLDRDAPGVEDQAQWRYPTEAEAVAGHQKVVDDVVAAGFSRSS